MKISPKILAALLAGIIALAALVYFHSFSKHYFMQRQEINKQINQIKTAEKELDYLVLNSGFYLYHNQDAISHQIDILNNLAQSLYNDKHIAEHHSVARKALENYQAALDDKINNIYDFQTSNTSIKNASIAIPLLTQKSISTFDTSKQEDLLFLNRITSLNSSILLAKSTLDAQLLNHLEEQISVLESLHFNDENKQSICNSLILNLKVFRDFFPLYLEAIQKIENSQTTATLKKFEIAFTDQDIIELSTVTNFSYFLVILYLFSLGLIIYFLIRSESDGRTDKLTSLGNRKRYEWFIQNYPQSTLFLININKFKNYNDFYGTAFGDQILIRTAQALSAFSSSQNCTGIFRLGSDEFGILFPQSEMVNLEDLGAKILAIFHNESIVIDEIAISLSVSISISNTAPLLETADMGLKILKKDRSNNLIVYTDELNQSQNIRDNILRTHELKEAIESNALFPHFQPIVSLHSGNIEKYESLARIRTQSGNVESIFGYLDVVKESKYYPTLTRIMLQKSCEIMKDKSFEFSINLSIEDINDSETLLVIDQLFLQYPNISSRVVFEILESEAVSDYQKIADFIKHIKSHGCKVAIDDFGSGYSNFAHILNFDIDFIKIDGSLIRHLDTNTNAVMIVETIVSFAHKAGIKTIAEFVCDEAICTIIKKLGVDYSQGYYTGKPESLS
jgi:diguanylate cyclase (GGDEF)-like protein